MQLLDDRKLELLVQVSMNLIRISVASSPRGQCARRNVVGNDGTALGFALLATP